MVLDDVAFSMVYAVVVFYVVVVGEMEQHFPILANFVDFIIVLVYYHALCNMRRDINV